MRIKSQYCKRVPVSKGTTILCENPFSYVVRSAVRDERCDYCLQSGKLSKCSGCQYVYYCDHNCQRESWPIHKTECTNLKKISPKVIPDAARLMARVIIKLNQGGADEIGYYSETNFRKFKDLMSHLNMNSIGVGIYLGASVMDHSCKPNAVAVFEGTTIIVRTLVDLPFLDWSQIRISYVDLLNSNKDRQGELHHSYYFCCNCEKCKQAEPMAEAAACPNSSCDFPCLIENDKCEKCGTKLSENFIRSFYEVKDFTTHHLETMKTMAYLDVSKICLKKQKGILHSFNIQHIRTLDTAFIAAVNLECWEDAELYSKELVPGYL
ncbi:PREDICTED: histone-lysine N-methyltransferase ASHR1 isoform X4 [Dinoponera quadriceps]|uniref:Histone-lysine N-methyltransferase ASHR1 isoform X4 n=1 Tax=Dinoponera quadriceps TaxID=609295 RepID=A0A6P3Y9A4_DINQU|nr:PREDICTED: histone-lysine N-methyltransferase ASHR1 isoform X4 [Dinoponera quadriceps]